MEPQAFIALASGILVAASTGFAVAFKWIKAETKAAVLEATKSLSLEVESLKRRVSDLETGQREARTHISEALQVATEDGHRIIQGLLLKAQETLH